MRLLFIEDEANDVDLAVAELRRFGFQLEHERVQTLDGLRRMLEQQSWSAIVADYDLAGFTAWDALKIVRERDREIPFVLVSGPVGDEVAIEMMRAGANDCLTKDRLARLGPAIERELRDVQLREERRTFFAALRRAEDRYRRVFENVPVGIAIGAPDGTLLTVNDRFTKILGRRSDEIIGRRISDFALDGPLPPATSEPYERRYVRPDGSLAWVSISATCLGGDTAEATQMAWLVEDVTRHKQQQSVLRAQKTQFEEAQRMARMGSYEMDLDTKERVWSDELFRIFGFQPGPPDVALLDSRMHPEDVRRIHDSRGKVLDHIGPFADEYRVVLPGGDVRTIYDRGTFICDEQGRPLKIVGVAQDITESRMQEQELERRNVQQAAVAQLSRVALRSVDDAISIASTIVADVLGAVRALFHELDEKTECLRARGAEQAGAVGLDDESHIALAVRQNEPAFAIADGLCGAVAVPVASGTRRFGALAADAHDARTFGDRDVEFLQAVANIIADGMDREHARHALAASELRNREIIEGASEIIFTMSNRGRFTSLNAAFEKIIGWDTQQWLGKRFRDIVHPGDAAELARLFATVAQKQQSDRAELRILGRDSIVLLDISSFPKIENGRTTAVYGFARDVTEARRVDRERQQLTRNLQLLLESTVEGIITIGLEGRCLMSNRAAAEMLGRAPDDMTGAALDALIDGQDAGASADIMSVARSGGVRSVTNGTFWRADTTAIPVEYSAAPIVDEGRRVGVVISFSDISERRKLEMKLEQADRLASLGRLAATIAHEFNNVLMGIAPFVEVIRRGRNVESSLDHVGRAVQRGKRITQDILRFTQPAQPLRTSLHVGDWIDNVTLEARSLLPATCRVRSSVESGLHIDGDSTQLQQIFTNLILNARDAMLDGGTLTIEVRREPAGARLPFAVDHPERFAHFIVRDTGCGMSAETQRHIFEPLFTTKKNGTGLGLPVTHQVVQRHGGDIFVESTPGAGTAFHIFLPLAEAPPAMSAPEAVSETAPVAGARRVLLVEDDAIVADGIVSLLELEGLSVQVAASGEEALRRVDEIGPDVVVLDVGLPDMEGTAVYSILAQRCPDLPIVFSTGHADRAKLDEIAEGPRVAFLLKPYDSSALLGAIHGVVV